LIALMLVRAMSVGLTAVVGAYLVFSALICLGGGIGIIRSLPQHTIISMGIIGLLSLAGIAAQLAAGDPDAARLAREDAQELKRKNHAEREAKERWERYLS